MENWFRKIQPYLPSKKFSLVIGLVAGIALLIIFGSSIFGSHSSFLRGTRNAPVKAKGTLGEVIERDSNKNGIPDWEESLWGLDPKGNGKENKRLIEEQKKEKGITETSTEGVPKTESDIFVQDLLTTILALNQSGRLTPEAVGNIAQSIDATIDEKRISTVDEYTKEDIVGVNVTTETKQQYKQDIYTLVGKYAQSSIGSEFEIIAEGLEKDKISLSDLDVVKQTYFDFAEELLQIPTPRNAVSFAVSFANASNKVGNSFKKIQKIYTDLITGMVGIDEFIQASDEFDRAEKILSDYFYYN